jgi:hypothetical protein
MGESARLAYKAYEIEEFVDIYFFRRFGYLIALAARLARLTPNSVSVLAAVAGVAGGALLYDERLAIAGFGLLVLHGMFDSADGQLARMTGQTSELGRMLDGLAGYLSHAAIYLAIVAAAVDRDGSWSILAWACLAGLCNTIHAQMYDYHRTTYARLAIKGVIHREGACVTPERPTDSRACSPYALVRAYEGMQRVFTGAHPRVEAQIAARAIDGVVRDEDRVRYRSCFYGPVRGWNLLGDNVRRFAIGVLVLIDHLPWFIPFILVPMNIVLVALWLWQWRADRRFLDHTSPCIGSAEASGVSRLNQDQNAERGARMARRDDREDREYLSEEQRSQPGCPAREVVLDHPRHATKGHVR